MVVPLLPPSKGEVEPLRLRIQEWADVADLEDIHIIRTRGQTSRLYTGCFYRNCNYGARNRPFDNTFADTLYLYAQALQSVFKLPP